MGQEASDLKLPKSFLPNLERNYRMLLILFFKNPLCRLLSWISRLGYGGNCNLTVTLAFYFILFYFIFSGGSCKSIYLVTIVFSSL